MSFTIKELESLSGIRAHTIRIWEQRYSFLRPLRTQTNIRTYNNEELKTLLTVALLNRFGYKISRIDGMEPAQREEALLHLTQPEAGIERLVNQLIGCMIDLRNNEFEKVLNDYIRRQGMVQAVTVLIFQFLEKVGILWQANRIIPVQEHIVSSIIRQKIVCAIDGLPFVDKTAPLFLLFLPEDEHHEFGLLYIYYLLRRKGIPVIYLGANVPIRDVCYLLEVKKPDYLYLHLISFPRQHSFLRYLSQLSREAGEARILISGAMTQLHKRPALSNTIFLESLSEVTTFIDRLD